MKNTWTDTDKIIAFLLGNISQNQLNKSEKLKLERLYIADDLIRHYKSRRKVIPILMARVKRLYEEKGEKDSYGRTTAYQDFEDTQLVFGSTAKNNRDYHVDLLFEQIAEDRRLAVARKDQKAMTQCTKNLITAIATFLGDSDKIAPGEFELPKQVFEFNPKLLGVALPEHEEDLFKKLEELRKTPKQKIKYYEKEQIEDVETKENDSSGW